MSRISKIKAKARRRGHDMLSRKIKHAMKMLDHPKPVSKDDAVLTPKRPAAKKK